MSHRHNVQFPPQNLDELGQDQAFFSLIEDGEARRIRLHDYDEIFSRPGLYEQVVYERLRCQSPAKVREVLHYAVSCSRARCTELRVLDLGAGNGMMGDELRRMGASRLVGVDIIEEAREATDRDRPGVYDGYSVVDFCELSGEDRQEFRRWNFNCLTTVAALGFGDIPTRAFVEALNLISADGWVAFNIKETFLEHSDRTGFSTLIRELIFSDFLDLYRLERYRHRYSVDGTPLYYFAISGRKNGHVPGEFLETVAQ